MTREQKLEFYETNVTLLWFLMDGFWGKGVRGVTAILSLLSLALRWGFLFFLVY